MEPRSILVSSVDPSLITICGKECSLDGVAGDGELDGDTEKPVVWRNCLPSTLLVREDEEGQGDIFRSEGDSEPGGDG